MIIYKWKRIVLRACLRWCRSNIPHWDWIIIGKGKEKMLWGERCSRFWKVCKACVSHNWSMVCPQKVTIHSQRVNIISNNDFYPKYFHLRALSSQDILCWLLRTNQLLIYMTCRTLSGIGIIRLCRSRQTLALLLTFIICERSPLHSNVSLYECPAPRRQ